MQIPSKRTIVRLLLIALPLLWLSAGLAREQDPDMRWVVRQLEADDVAELAPPQIEGDATAVAEATHPQTDHIFRLDATQNTLLEMDESGEVLYSYTVSDLDLQTVADMRFAISVDTTDDPQTVNLYVWSGEGQIYEMWPAPARSLTATVEDSVEATLVSTTDTSQYSPPSPDPAGLSYLPGANRLLISDSEVNEMDIYEGANLFYTSLGGGLRHTADTTQFTAEPTGVAYNPGNERLFFSDDDDDLIHEVAMVCEDDDDTPIDDCDEWRLADGDDGGYLSSFSTADYGSIDAEGITFADGVLFSVDGRNREVYRIDPGANGKFGDDNDVVTSFDLGELGVRDPEGIAYDARSGRLFVVDSATPTVYEVTTDGNLVTTIDISDADPLKGAGVVLAPASDGSGDTHLYVVDRGVDNNDDPNENDGRLYEFSLPAGVGPPTPTHTPTASATHTTQPTGTATATTTSTPDTVTPTATEQTPEPTATAPPSGTDTPTPTTEPTATGTVTPEPPRDPFFMPLVFRNIHDKLGEPNDTCAMAYPIEPSQTWQFLAEDRDDWYRFRLEQDANLRVELDNFAPQAGQLAVYRGESCGTAVFLGNNGSSSEQKAVDLGDQPAGQYFIFVSNDGPLNQDDFYTLFIVAE